MKVLHINQSDTLGGAAIAAHRLHTALPTQNIQSKLLVDKQQSSSDCTASIPRRHYLDSLSSRLAYYAGLNYVNHKSTFNISSHPFYLAADVLNFHNLHGDYFNYLALPKLTKRKPAVLTLHDMWSFTGHCAYSFECNRWETGCGKCPALTTYPAVSCDHTSIEWKLKKWTYKHSNLTIVSPSSWLAKLASKSLLEHYQIHTIPNGLDVQCYRPLDKVMCRAALELPSDKTVLLFSAQSLSDSRKGGDLLFSALSRIPTDLKQDLLLLLFGSREEGIEKLLDIPVRSLGYISGDQLKALVYSAADLFIFPTRADNLPLVLQESMACGLPMISFDIGGVPELVRPDITGYLAQPENAADLSARIVDLIEDSELRQFMAIQCRKIAVEEYSIELQSIQYGALYREVISSFESKG